MLYFRAVEKNELEIIQQSMQLFMKLGIKSLTMDDVARSLGISKKTLYKFVTDKQDLVEKVLMYSCEIDNSAIEGICQEGHNAIDESYNISMYILTHINRLHPSIMYDLQKYHLSSWEKFTNEKRNKIKDCYTRNIEKGIAEGLYREDLNVRVIVNLYVSRFEIIFNPDLFPVNEFNPAENYLELFRYHIRGIASDKGLKYLIKKVQKEKQK